jgi:hypothetical protein
VINAYYTRHVRPSVSLHASAPLSMKEFSLIFIVGIFMEICRLTPNSAKIGQKYLAQQNVPKYLDIVDNGTKYFVARQRCKTHFLHFHTDKEHFYSVDSCL